MDIAIRGYVYSFSATGAKTPDLVFFFRFPITFVVGKPFYSSDIGHFKLLGIKCFLNKVGKGDFSVSKPFL